jgi:hypothetical protein
MSMREAYLEKVRAQLAEWQTWIEQYRQTEMDGQAERMLQRLEDSCQVACCQLETLQSAHGSAWESTKQAVECALIELKQLLDESGAGQAGQHLVIQSSRAHAFEPFPRKA